MEHEIAAGWYPDPSGHHAWRWWDGLSWNEAVRDEEGSGAPPTTPNEGDSEQSARPAPAALESAAQQSRNRVAGGTQSGTARSGPVRTPALTFGEAVSNVFRNFWGFEGRARRSEFWWYFLLQAGVLFAAFLIGVVAMVAVGVVLFLPYLSVAVRRMHDIGRSGAWVFWLLCAPQLVQLLGLLVLNSGALGAGLTIIVVSQVFVFIGMIVAIVLLALPGSAEPNAYGSSPAHGLA